MACLKGILLNLLWKGLERISLMHISSKDSSFVSLSFANHRSSENSHTTIFCPASLRALWSASWTSLVSISWPVGRVFGDSLCSIVSVCTVCLG